MKLIQKRRYFKHGTFSEVFTSDGDLVCVLVERPWLNNQPSISCVPEGEYTLSPHVSPSKGKCLILEAHTLGVYHFEHPKAVRTHILWHIGNTVGELKGCAAVGEEFGTLGAWAVINSRDTMEYLNKLINEQVILVIEKA